jgi:hypothetical protein
VRIQAVTVSGRSGAEHNAQQLAGDDRRNHGQVLVEDAVTPGSTLLGYVDADFWDIAISIDRQMPHLSARKSPRQFPRPVLLDAMLLYVSESLESLAPLAH